MSNRIAFRMKYRDKDTKQYFDCGTVFAGRFEDSFDVAPQKTDEDGQYPKMRADKALALAIEGKGYISLMTPKGQQQKREEPKRSAGWPTVRGEDDSDLPF